MDALALPLVLTKLRVPAARARLIPRARLVNLLVAENETGLVLICAPAGYGKTTLLAEWAQSRLLNGAAVAWYAIDAVDDDPIPFGAYLVASLIHALGPTSELARLAQLQRSSPELDLRTVLAAAINAIASNNHDCLLILDDYHLISSPAIHSALAFLLEHLPENMLIAIGSRSEPPLPLARLRTRRQLLEIRSTGLRFTADETALFLNGIMHLELSPPMIAALEARTEGWIAGLQLAALSLAGRSDKENFIASFTGSHRYLVEYLLEEVFIRQPEPVQTFLLSTSILERLCAPLCDAILGESAHSEAILEKLQQANLFLVSLDDQGYWRRYHHLFRDFLQNRLVKTWPERIAGLQRAASAWYAAHDFLREAAQHAFQTRDWDYAAAFVEQYSFTMIIHSEIATIYEWCSAFPEEVMKRHPLLYLHQCWALVFSFRRQNRPRIEERLRQADQVIAAMEDRQLAGELGEQAAVIRSFLIMAPDPGADPQAQLALAQAMLDSYPQADPGRFSALLISAYARMALHEADTATAALETARQIALGERLYFGIVESTFHLARLAHSQGQLRRAAEICRQGQADIAAILTRPEQELPALGGLDIALGCVLLEQDRLDEAERCLLSGLDLIGPGMNPYYTMTAHVALFRLRVIQSRPADALACLAELEELWPDIAFCTHGLRVVHALRTAPQDRQTLAEAAAWRRDFSPSLGADLLLPGIGPFGAAEAYYLAHLAWVRAGIAAGDAPAARSWLERQLTLAQAHGLTDRVIELSLLEAELESSVGGLQGDDRRAWAALKRALVAAQPQGYLRIFDQGPALTRLLVEAARRGIYREDIGRILAVIAPSESLPIGPESDAAAPGAARRPLQASRPEIPATLSERELELLRLMARGASNQEIAGQLVITVGTVKSHINHILGKLNAHNRTEAVARARELNLLA